MRYVHGSAAEQLAHEELASSSSRPSLNVVTSPNAARRSDAYLSPLAVCVLKAVAAVGVALALACVARIAIITQLFEVNASNNELINQIDEARVAGNELEVQQSIYGNSERVRSIATDVYGMVPAGQVTTVNAQATDEPAAEPAE